MTATKPKSARAVLIGAVKAEQKKHGLDDDTYRAMLLAQTGGKTSAKDCTDAELRKVLDHLKGGRAGSRSRAGSPHAGKIRALWISMFNLGVVRDPSEKALASYVHRQIGVDALQWLEPGQAFRVIEALKSWAVRAAGVEWDKDGNPRRDVIRAQWLILAQAKAAPALDLAAYGQSVTGKAVLSACADAELDRLQEALGALVRKVREPVHD